MGSFLSRPRTFSENITDGQAYVLEEKGRVHGTFVFIVGEEPMYTKICDGQWRKNETYGTVHRLASYGTVKGAGRACLTFVQTGSLICGLIRIRIICLCKRS